MKLPMKKSNPRKNRTISDRVENINYSVVRKSFVKGSNSKMINATIGRPDFDVPVKIKEEAKLHIDLGHNAYTETKGIAPLRQAISKHLQKRNVNRSPDEIIVTSGTTSAIFMVISALINPDDEVIIFEPYFVAYPEIVKMVGGKCVILKTNTDFQPDISLLRKSIANKTKLIIVNSPNNPTGAVYNSEMMKEIVRVAKKAGAYILSDEIYHDFIYKKIPHYSPAEKYKKTIIVDGLAKSKGMSGWRIGFVAGPKKIIDAVEKLQQFTSVCAPAPFQHAAVLAFTEPFDQDILNQYRRKREALIEGIKDNYQIVIPDGAFYLFLKTPIPAEKFTMILIKKGLAVVPGSAFGNYKNFIRISYAISDKEIEKMIDILKDVVKEK